MSDDIMRKYIWLSRQMKGEDSDIVAALFNALPCTDSVDDEEHKRLELRNYMAELFARGISLRWFCKETGITGFPAYPPQPGLEKNPDSGNLCYFDCWIADKDPSVASQAIKNILKFRKEQSGDSASYFTAQLAVDIDSDNKQYPSPLAAGLTAHAVCMEIPLANIEKHFGAIEAACATVSKSAVLKMRFFLGAFAGHEYDGLCKGSIFTKHMPFDMGTEWILFKNIHRRAGKLGWFWRLVARRNDAADNRENERQRREHERMQEEFRRQQQEQQQQQ